jgi:hypothetical protein
MLLVAKRKLSKALVLSPDLSRWLANRVNREIWRRTYLLGTKLIYVFVYVYRLMDGRVVGGNRWDIQGVAS